MYKKKFIRFVYVRTCMYTSYAHAYGYYTWNTDGGMLCAQLPYLTRVYKLRKLMTVCGRLPRSDRLFLTGSSAISEYHENAGRGLSRRRRKHKMINIYCVSWTCVIRSPGRADRGGTRKKSKSLFGYSNFYLFFV